MFHVPFSFPLVSFLFPSPFVLFPFLFPFLSLSFTFPFRFPFPFPFSLPSPAHLRPFLTPCPLPPGPVPAGGASCPAGRRRQLRAEQGRRGQGRGKGSPKSLLLRGGAEEGKNPAPRCLGGSRALQRYPGGRRAPGIPVSVPGAQPGPVRPGWARSRPRLLGCGDEEGCPGGGAALVAGAGRPSAPFSPVVLQRSRCPFVLIAPSSFAA